MTDGIRPHVARFRARVRAVLVVRTLLAFGTFWMAMAAVLMAAGVATGGGAWLSIGGAALLAVVSGAAAGWWRTPEPTAVASLIDTHLQLQDRVAAAWPLADERDLMSRLIVQDAVRRIAQVDPRQLFPMPLGWRVAPPMVALAAALSLATTDARLPLESGRAAGAAAGPVSSARTGIAAPDSPDSPDPGARMDPAARADNAATSSPAAAIPREPSRVGSPVETTADGRAATRRDDGTNTSAAMSAASRSGAVPEAMAGAEASAARGGSAAGRGSGEPSGGASGRDGGSAGRRAAGGAGSGASSGTDALTGAAGGVRGNVLAGEPLAPGDPLRRGISPAGIARVASSQAESVTLRDDIPPSRRQYVRDYFLGLQRNGIQP